MQSRKASSTQWGSNEILRTRVKVLLCFCDLSGRGRAISASTKLSRSHPSDTMSRLEESASSVSSKGGRSSSWVDELASSIVTEVFKTSPLIQCITNYVSMDFMANTLLAIGASPAMVIVYNLFWQSCVGHQCMAHKLDPCCCNAGSLQGGS